MLLVLLSPLLFILALAVRLGSAGPILFRQRRVGRDGSVFDLYKFRSMRVAPVEDPTVAVASGTSDSGGAEALTTLARDIAPGGVEGRDRRTTVGRVLRRTSLDELPQLFNVLKGDMSVIGPRPERPEFVELFDQDVSPLWRSPSRQVGHHRLGAGARPTWADLVGRENRAGQLLHRASGRWCWTSRSWLLTCAAVPQRRVTSRAEAPQMLFCARLPGPAQYW